MKASSVIILAGMVCILLIAAGCTGTAPATTAATSAAPSASLPAETAAPVSWTGSWNTSWLESNGNTTYAPVNFTQAGSDVTGTYHYAYAGEGVFTGSLNATLADNTITGTYRETDNDTGLFAFAMAEDRKSFTGRWVHAPSNASALANSTLAWNGVRK